MSLTLIIVINYHQLHLWLSSDATVATERARGVRALHSNPPPPPQNELLVSLLILQSRPLSLMFLSSFSPLFVIQAHNQVESETSR